jgi:hypothetical protein
MPIPVAIVLERVGCHAGTACSFSSTWQCAIRASHRRLVGDREGCLIRHVGPVDRCQMRADLPGGQPFRGRRQHHVLDPAQPADDPRLEAAVPVPGHTDLDRPDIGQHRLGPRAVAGVPAVLAGRVMPVLAEVSSPSSAVSRTRLVNGCNSPPSPVGCNPRAAGVLDQLGRQRRVLRLLAYRRGCIRGLCRDGHQVRLLDT